MAFVCKSERQLGNSKAKFPEVGPGSYIGPKNYDARPS